VERRGVNDNRRHPASFYLNSIRLRISDGRVPCKGQSAATRYWLWLMAALKFAVPTFVFTSLGDWLHRAWVPERLFADWVVNFPTAPLMGHSDFLLPSGSILSYETAWDVDLYMVSRRVFPLIRMVHPTRATTSSHYGSACCRGPNGV
jgi:hypothetical protein